MGNDVIGVNEQALDKLILDIYDYADRINIILNSIEDVFDKCSNYFVDDSSNNFKHKVEQLKLNFPIVNNNIRSYATDLVKVKGSFINSTVDLATFINKKAIDAKDDIEIL